MFLRSARWVVQVMMWHILKGRLESFGNFFPEAVSSDLLCAMTFLQD